MNDKIGRKNVTSKYNIFLCVENKIGFFIVFNVVSILVDSSYINGI